MSCSFGRSSQDALSRLQLIRCWWYHRLTACECGTIFGHEHPVTPCLSTAHRYRNARFWTSAKLFEIKMADMDVDTPAPSKKEAKDDGKQRFEVKKVWSCLSHTLAPSVDKSLSGMQYLFGHGVRCLSLKLIEVFNFFSQISSSTTALYAEIISWIFVRLLASHPNVTQRTLSFRYRLSGKSGISIYRRM